ncbi:S1 family peptidase [Streptomyces sp. NPDC059477]|uniref:S1 family peptidase n=1 Tax=Streptomyces sp. NPDC059477 TaxID=3346847 RepID=UPI0036BE74C6
MTRHSRPVLTAAALATALLTGSLALAAPSATAVTGPASGASDTTHAYTARIVVGAHDRGCSGVLVAPEWVLTAASCFAADPAVSLVVPAGKPALRTTATIGRTDLTTTQGAVRDIVELVPRADRDAVLARLSRPVTDVTPIALSGAAPTTGEQLTLAGYGRSATEWAPLTLRTGTFTVDAATATTATVTGQDGVAACMGDTGGPLVRTVGDTRQLAALVSQSYQGGCFGIDATETRTAGVTTRVDDLASWVSTAVAAPRVTDFNCDGTADVAVADPAATVGGDAGAGLVRVVYGGGKGTAELNQDLDWVPGGAEAGDGFGTALATVDHDQDGCTDVVVGTPGDDLGTATDAGMVDILYGAPGGLGTGATKAAHFEQGSGTGSLAASASETGDRMGHALAAGTTAAGEPFVAMGVPGESLGTVARAGGVFYLHGGTNIAVNQEATGVSGAAETDDAFGSSLAADGLHLAVGVPGETVGTDADAGMVSVFSHQLNAEGRPTPRFGMEQDLDAVSGAAEAGDLFGQSLAMVAHRPSATAATESILAVGSPGETLAVDAVDKAETGWVLTFRITAAGTFSQLDSYSSGTGDDDVSGTSEAGDHFGQYLTAVNTAPGAVSTPATLRLAVGIPGEAIGTTAGAGAISTFSLLDPVPGASDRWLEAGDGDGVPGVPGANQRLGSSIHYTGTHLYVGMPDGPSATGALHALPLSNTVAGGTVAPVTTYQPGQGGLPATGDRFGHAAR